MVLFAGKIRYIERMKAKLNYAAVLVFVLVSHADIVDISVHGIGYVDLDPYFDEVASSVHSCG